jgi:hypothetical protein
MTLTHVTGKDVLSLLECNILELENKITDIKLIIANKVIENSPFLDLSREQELIKHIQLIIDFKQK